MAYRFNPTTGNLDIVADPGGSDTQIQFNDGGTFGGDIDLTYNKTTNLLTSKGDILLDDGGSFTTTLQTVTATANRTISFPDATGTVALVGGSSGQVLVNTNGAVAGLSTLTADGSGNLTLTARLINAFNALASAPAKLFSGTWFTGGTSTTTKPHVLIEPAGTTSTNWSTAGTGLGVNAPSGFTGNLLDMQVAGSSLSGACFNRFGFLGIGNSNPLNTIHLSRDANHGITLERLGSSPGTATISVLPFGQCFITASNQLVLGTNSFLSSVKLDVASGTGFSLFPDFSFCYRQESPINVNVTSTLTAANIKRQLITCSPSSAIDLTLPSGSEIESTWTNQQFTNITFQWNVANTGSGAATLQPGTDHTVVGSMVVSAGASGSFATRRTAANTYVTYRLS